jgi:hypothetical protein
MALKPLNWLILLATTGYNHHISDFIVYMIKKLAGKIQE